MTEHSEADSPSAESRLNGECLERSIAALFEQQVAAGPSKLAVKSRRHTFSYAALDQMANGIAQHITNAGRTDNEPVVLLLDPDAPLVAAILGVLKAGKTCVPLRPSQPPAKLRRAVRSTGARLVMTDTDNLPAVRKACDGVEHVLNVELIQACSAPDDTGKPLSPASVAYILYSSGSAGEPRGVAHTHQSLVHLTMGSADALRITPEDRIALIPSSSFIGAARNIFGALLNGASLHPFNVNAEGLDRFARWLVDEEITIYHFVPTFFRHFVSSLDGRISFPRLRLVYLGGEPVRKSDVDSFRKHFAPDAILVNGYGTTETGAIRRYFIDKETPIDGAIVPVGYPVADKEVFILDEAGRRLGADRVGEIAVRSRYLSAGYWRQPQATEAAFSAAAEGGDEVLYRTGDLGRMTAEGCLEHLGRKDSQVKIRGHRVDVAEVETLLSSLPSTTDVAVITRDDKSGETRLVAYVASRSMSDLTVGDLRRSLQKSLPSYSIPTNFVFMGAIPRSPRGKLERSALPDPPAGRPQLGEPLVAPRTEIERLLTKLWGDVLQIDEIGVNDNFFELGGDSLSATRLLNRIQQQMVGVGDYIHMAALFDTLTVARFAEYLQLNYPAAISCLPQDSESNRSPTATWKPLPPLRARIDASRLSQMRRTIASKYSVNDLDVTSKNPAMVFVLCSSHSGSTLLRVILGGHPALLAPPELRLLGYNSLAEREAAHSDEDAMMLEGAIRAVMRISGRTAAQARDLLTELAERGTSSLSFYRMLQDWLGKVRLVDKTPSYALHAPILRRAEACFDNPYYIHLVRHPFGVIRSSQEIRLDLVSPFRHQSSSVDELAEMLWLISHQNILHFLERVPASRHHRVQFENLVREPESVVRGVCDFLNLDFDPEMLLPYEDQSGKMTDGIHAETRMIGDIKFHEHDSIDPTVADRWKKRSLRYKLSSMTWDLAETLGYDRT